MTVPLTRGSGGIPGTAGIKQSGAERECEPWSSEWTSEPKSICLVGGMKTLLRSETSNLRSSTSGAKRPNGRLQRGVDKFL